MGLTVIGKRPVTIDTSVDATIFYEGGAIKIEVNEDGEIRLNSEAPMTLNLFKVSPYSITIVPRRITIDD